MTHLVKIWSVVLEIDFMHFVQRTLKISESTSVPIPPTCLKERHRKKLSNITRSQMCHDTRQTTKQLTNDRHLNHLSELVIPLKTLWKTSARGLILSFFSPLLKSLTALQCGSHAYLSPPAGISFFYRYGKQHLRWFPARRRNACQRIGTDTKSGCNFSPKLNIEGCSKKKQIILIYVMQKWNCDAGWKLHKFSVACYTLEWKDKWQ